MNSLEHLVPFYSGKPEAVSICIVIAGAPAMAFDEGSTAELLQARTGGRQGLARALCTSTGVLQNAKALVTHALFTSSDTTLMNSLVQIFLHTSLPVLCSVHLLFFVAQLKEEQGGGAEGSRDGIGFSHSTAA